VLAVHVASFGILELEYSVDARFVNVSLLGNS
jgi:hypothetical protein